MKKIVVSCLLCICAAVCFAQSAKSNFDFGWKFAEADVPGAEAPTFDDSSWLPVDLPHDWDILHAPSPGGASGNDGGYYPGGIGWYRKVFRSPQAEGCRVKLHFEGVYQRSRIYVNGIPAGMHAYGYTPFYVDITDCLKDGDNLVAVRVDNSLQPNCRWYSGSGIYRHTWLEIYNPSEMDDPTKLFVRTESISGISADGTRAESAKVRVTYGDVYDEVLTFNDIRLWSPDTPVLYDITVGKLTVKHGFRTFTYSPEDGFVLNGKPVLLNGACVHHDDGLVGAMAFDAAEIRKVRLMKRAGFNLVRTSHNPATRAFLDACDSLGLMVIDEMYDGWYTEKTRGDHHLEIDSTYREDFRDFVTADRNHPCIICWSIGNEVMERKDIRVIHTARKFKNEVLRWDDTRPVTEALCTWDDDWEIFDPHAEVLDIVGYNYLMFKHAEDHIRCPERVMWQTESFPRDAFAGWTYVHDFPYVIGDIVWTGLDYIGESGIGQFYYEGEPEGEHYLGLHFPFHGAWCGDVDITGWRKPVSHYRDMLYNVEEGDCSNIYLAVREPDAYKGKISTTSWSVWPTWESWNFPGWEGKEVEVEICTKAPAVNLYLNNQLVATREVSRATEYKAVIAVPYAPGSIRAVAVDAGGHEHASSSLVSPDEPYCIRLTPESRTISADGEDLAYILMEVTDRSGRRVPGAEVKAEVSVSGAGTLLAAGSANFKDIEPLTSGNVTTYDGRAVIVVRSGQTVGNVRIRVQSSLKRSVSTISIRSVASPNQ